MNTDFENDTDITGAGDLTIDEIDQLGHHPDLAAVSDEFAQMISGLDWDVRRRLDEMFGRAMLRGLEVGHAAGRAGVNLAMHF